MALGDALKKVGTAVQPPIPRPVFEPTPFLGGSVETLPGYVPPDSGRALQPWQVEDRQMYQKAQAQIAAAQAEIDRITRIGQAQRTVRLAEEEKAATSPFALAERYPDGGLERRLTPTEEVEQGLRRPRDITSGPRAAFNATAGRGLPYRDEVGEVVRQVSDTIAPVVPGVGPLAQGSKMLGGPSLGDVHEVLVPRTFGEAGLELLPGVGLVPDIARGVRRAATSEGVTQVGRRLASESGQSIVPGPPESVIKALARRAKKGERPTTPERLAARWEVIPPENRKLIENVGQIFIPVNERKVLRQEAARRQAGEIAEKLRAGVGGDPQEALASARATRGGNILPRSRPVGNLFTDEEVTSFYTQITSAPFKGLLGPHEAVNAADALDLIMKGARANGSDAPLMPHELKYLGRVFGPEFEAILPRTKEELTRLQKIFAPFQVWRSIKSGFDNSALGRQGRKVMFSDPGTWYRSIGPNLRALRSDEGYEAVMDNVYNSPYFALGQSLENRLGVIERGSGEAEEWLSPITKHIPLLSASERAYLGFLNTVRQALFDKDVEALIKAYDGLENVPIQSIQNVANNINNATMFGNISALGDFQKAAGQTFFSVRGLVSGPQFHADLFRAMKPGADPTVRKIVAKRWGGYVGSSVSSLIAANLAGYALNEAGIPVPVRAELNPWSASFGEVRVGPVKFNPWGSDANLVRATIQWVSARQLGEGEKEPHQVSRNTVASRFIRNKFSPAASTLFDLMWNDGKDYEGRPIIDRPWQYPLEQASPLFWYDVQESMREQGWWGLGSVGQSLGGDVQVYGAGEKAAEQRVKDDVLVAAKEYDPTAIIEGGKLGFDNTQQFQTTWRPTFRADFGSDIDKYDTIDALKTAYLDLYGPQLAEQRGYGEQQGRADAGTAFEAFASVKQWRESERSQLLNFWQKHPDLLQQATQAGLNTLNADEREILGE